MRNEFDAFKLRSELCMEDLAAAIEEVGVAGFVR